MQQRTVNAKIVEIYEKEFNKENQSLKNNVDTKIPNELLLRSFFRFFTTSEDECIEKVLQNKKIPKSCLINVSDVSNIRKGIDCLNNINEKDINHYFFKNAQQLLKILIDNFNASSYFCPKCEIELDGASVICEKCLCWYHIKCAKNFKSGPWHCDASRCKI